MSQPSSRRVWARFIAVGLILSSAVGWLYLFSDGDPPDSTLYQVEYITISELENALEVFDRDTTAARQSMNDDWRRRQQNDDHGIHEFNPQATAALRDHVQLNRDLLETFWAFVRESPRPLAIPGIAPKMDLTLSTSSMYALLEGAKLAHRAIRLDILTGQSNQALTASLNLAAFAKDFSRADSALLNWLVVTTVYGNAMDGIQAALPEAKLNSATARDLQHQLALHELSSKDLAKVLRIEVNVQMSSIASIKKDGAYFSAGRMMPKLHWLPRQLIKPNMSTFDIIDLHLPLANALDRNWKQGIHALAVMQSEAEQLYSEANWHSKLHPNWVGRNIVALGTHSISSVTAKTLQWVAVNRCLSTAIALRMFELRTKDLPGSLAELTSKDMITEPIDPITGQIIRWHLSSGRIYSIGIDGIDNSGDFEPSKSLTGQRDWGIVYPWWKAEPQSTHHSSSSAEKTPEN